MFEVFLAVTAFGLGLWLGWSAGVEHGEERILKGSSRHDGSSLAAERVSQSQAQAEVLAYAELIKQQLSAPVQEESTSNERAELKWGDGPLGSVLRDSGGELVARLTLCADEGAIALLCNGMVWDEADPDKDPFTREFESIEDAKAAIELKLAAAGR